MEMVGTLTAEQEQAIAGFFEGRHIPSGLGTAEEACTVAGINIALTGRLTDAVPECMSLVIGWWVIRIQDAMPDEMRNGLVWRGLIPRAAGTGRDQAKELARRDLVLDWMWGTVLPQLQGLADRRGFGESWRDMCELRTYESAQKARAYATAAAYAAYAAYAATADAAAYATATAAYATATATADAADFWERVDPPGLLARLVAI